MQAPKAEELQLMRGRLDEAEKVFSALRERYYQAHETPTEARNPSYYAALRALNEACAVYEEARSRCPGWHGHLSPEATLVAIRRHGPDGAV